MVSPLAFTRKSVRSMSSSVAALALITASALPVMLAATPSVASAQDEESNSANFGKVYGPIAQMVSGDTKDWVGAAAQVPTIVAAIENNRDRNVAGNFMLAVGNEIAGDPAQEATANSLRRRGLELMIESGLTNPAQVGPFNHYIGRFAYNDQEFDVARQRFNAALAAGYTNMDGPVSDQPAILIFQTYLNEDRDEEALNYLISVLNEREINGGGVYSDTLVTALGRAYRADAVAQANTLARMLILDEPDTNSWIASLQVVVNLNEMDDQGQLDLYRLMRETDAMTQRTEFARYIDYADPRIMSNEVEDVLAAGLREGHFETDGSFYIDVKSVVDARAAGDRRDIETTVRDGRGGDSVDAMSAGDVLYSLDDWARAEELYTIGMDKGADRNVALTRIGMTQVKQGKFAEAIANFAQVTGERKPVADFWSLYAELEMPAEMPAEIPPPIPAAAS